MSGIAIKFHHGPITHRAETAVTGGQIVEAGAEPRSMRPATAGSATVLGVVIADAAPKSDNYVPVPEHAAVACAPAQVPVTSDGTAGVGDLVIAADGGTVTAAPADAAQNQIVGRVIETLSGGAVSVRLYC